MCCEWIYSIHKLFFYKKFRRGKRKKNEKKENRFTIVDGDNGDFDFDGSTGKC